MVPGKSQLALECLPFPKQKKEKKAPSGKITSTTRKLASTESTNSSPDAETLKRKHDAKVTVEPKENERLKAWNLASKSDQDAEQLEEKLRRENEVVVALDAKILGWKKEIEALQKKVQEDEGERNPLRGVLHGGRDSGRSGRGNNFERGQSIQQNWRGRGRGQRGGRSNHSNFECYKCGKYGHYAKDCNSFKCYNCDKVGHLTKDCRSEKKVEETTNLTLEAKANEGFLLMAQNEINSNDNVWYLDSGASNHMCGHKHLFKEMRKIEDGNVSFGDASKVKVEGKGTIRYLQKDGLIGSIQDVYYVPNLKTNILSLGQLTEKGYSILMKERILHLKYKLGHLIARVKMERNRMYKLNLINVLEKCLQATAQASLPPPKTHYAQLVTTLKSSSSQHLQSLLHHRLLSISAVFGSFFLSLLCPWFAFDLV
ncbi:hypothetical protein KIW84_063600 [Lathyrus oleraceus]|uniref:CCHC-type domain-containing protein n=1 Tax=Pisum sativum TaxID=3888 RepID=A0A9D4W9Y7_PEA|nr:hypothetical protein KIW84_063600 [Pisum sativum]